MTYLTDRITSDPDLCNGKPTIRGMRITVHTVLSYLAAGDSVEDVLVNYPFLEKEDINACISFASQVMNNEFTVENFAA